MSSAKTPIIEAIFDGRYLPSSGGLSNPEVTLKDVSAAISAHNAATGGKMSTGNVANFFKDFIRSGKNSNANWPPSVFARGYTARQVTGNNLCFRFVPLPLGQTVPFVVVVPSPTAPKFQIESVSLPLAASRLGRKDEPWLIQIVARLRIVESHFSLVAHPSRNIKQIDLLQLNVKLSKTEIDALFLAVEELPGGHHREIIITCEAKGKQDDILEDQVFQQAMAPFSMPQITQDRVIPIAIKATAASKVSVVEFNAVDRATHLSVKSLHPIAESQFEIVPAVPGIGK